MSHLAVILVLCSCFTHAGWNLLAKRATTGPDFFWFASLAVVVAALPVFWLWNGSQMVAAPRAVWGCLLITGLCQAAYYVFLALAYQRGDVSVVYPLARAAPVFVVPLAVFLQGQWPSLTALAGITLVAMGCFLLPLRRPGLRSARLAWQHTGRSAVFWAIATAMASAGYTVVDGIGMNRIKTVFPGMRGVFLYGYLEWVSTTAWLFLPAWFLAGGKAMRATWKQDRRTILLAGGLIFFTYLLILWAYTLSRQVAYVAALRQFSVVLGIIGAVRFLREPVLWGRVVGSLVIVAGLVLVVLAR